ncbi:MAG TPA: hypothetical protein VMZ52_09735 [Bryobacteraceae bacterium]|nr:hypothetical protein [Bryobacteraceae bacterium]
MLSRAIFLEIIAASLLFGQIPDNRLLNGKYFVRHLQITMSGARDIATIKGFSGTLLFDGNGGLTWQGQQTVGSSAPASLSGSGTYTVLGNGFVTLSSPQQSGASVNARVGVNAIVGSSTDSGSNLHDLLIAVPAPTGSVTNGALSGAYFVSSLDFPGGTTAQIREAFFKVNANAGSFGDLSISGQAANLGNQTVTQLVSGATYNLTADGSGSAVFPLPSGATAAGQLVSGGKALYVSKDGNFFLAGSSANGGQDMIVGVKAITGGATNASLKGPYFAAGLGFENEMNSYAAASTATGEGRLVSTRRVRAFSGPLDLTAVNSYSVNPDGTGLSAGQWNTFGLGSGGQAFVGGGTAANATGVYELYVGVRAISVTGTTSVFLNPQGVTNAASFAPTGAPIAPGEYISLFGSGLAPGLTTASSLPFPTTLGGVQVLINNRLAPMSFVSPGQINALVPFGTTESTASIVVNNNGSRSNSVTVPVARTSPGIFSVPSAGFGPGAILHADFSLVSASQPARPGETVLVFLTGLGAVSPAVQDGTAGPSAPPFSITTAPLNVYIDGLPAAVSFNGLAPGLAGYQMNVTVPLNAGSGSNIPIAIATPNAFHDQVDIAISR